MSASYVQEALELFNDDINGEDGAKKRKKISKRDSVQVSSRRKKRKTKLQKCNSIKVPTNAFDEQWRYSAIDRTETNLQFIKEQQLFHAADAKAVATIVEHQTRKSTQRRANQDVKKESEASVFTDRDFDRFRKQYVF